MYLQNAVSVCPIFLNLNDLHKKLPDEHFTCQQLVWVNDALQYFNIKSDNGWTVDVLFEYGERKKELFVFHSTSLAIRLLRPQKNN